MSNITDEIQTELAHLEYTQPQVTKLEYLTLEIWKKLIMTERYENLLHSAMDKAVEVANYMIQECNKECD
jgi:hypothetical protein